jgi:hypothetical protein
MKYIDPARFVIGCSSADPAIDVVFFATSCSYICLIFAITLNLSQFVVGTVRIVPYECRERFTKVVQQIDGKAFLTPLFGITFSTLPLFCYAFPEHSSALNNAYLFGFWGVLLYKSVLNFMLSGYAAQQMREVMERSTVASTDIKIIKAYKQLTVTRYASITKNILLISSWLVFTVVPLLRDKYFTSYYMCVYVINCIMCLHLLRGLWRFKGPTLTTVVPACPLTLLNEKFNRSNTPNSINDGSVEEMVAEQDLRSEPVDSEDKVSMNVGTNANEVVAADGIV